MIRLLRPYWIYLVSFAFILLNSVLIAQNLYWFSLLPLALTLVLASFFALDKLMLFIIFATPLSIQLEALSLGEISMFLPTEPLLFGVMLLFLIKLAYEKRFDEKVLRHPVSIMILINLFWIALTSLTSTMPLVSLKFLLARLWFVITFYFMATQLFRHYPNIRTSLWLYLIPFTGVILYTLINHSLHNFAEDPAHWVMTPFFKDHTSYGASLALYFPILIGALFLKRHSSPVKFLILMLVCLFNIAIVFSYTRATWVSLLGAAFILFCLFLRIRVTSLVVIGATAMILFFAYQGKILMELEQNRQDSSDELAEHVQSISNVASDASNLERINRWNCALRMFREKPLLGWGPGTYQFQYAPFQRSSEMTVISTNFGNKGNAHSEYLGPLAESGLLGSLSFLGIVLSITYTAFRVFYETRKSEIKVLLTSVFIGLVTYMIHGFLNNFLTTDKAAIPFWSFAAIIVVIDLYHKKSVLKDPEGE